MDSVNKGSSKAVISGKNNKKNQKEKKQREIRSKSKEKETTVKQQPAPLTTINSVVNVSAEAIGKVVIPEEPAMPSTEPILINHDEKAVETPSPAPVKKESIVVVKEGEPSEVSHKVDEDKQVGEEGSEYTLVKKKRKQPKQRTPPSKDSFQREQNRREPPRGRRSGGSRRKSVGSVPGSENSGSDGEDSVKSLPADCSSSEKVPKPCISSGGTPQTSYAEIVRIARDEERKKYGSSGSWTRSSGSESIPIEEFPSVICESEDMRTDKAVAPQSDLVSRNGKPNPDNGRSRKDNEFLSPVSNNTLSQLLSSAIVSSIDKNSPETIRVDCNNDTCSPSVPLSEPLVPSSVPPVNKIVNTNVVERRNNTNIDGLNTLNTAKSKQLPNNAGFRDSRNIKSVEGKSGQLPPHGQSSLPTNVQSKGPVRPQPNPKLDINSYLAKAAQNVGNSLSSNSSPGNASGLNSSPDVGFPALVSSDSYSPPPVTQGPWSNRLKQSTDKSVKEAQKPGEKATTPTAVPHKQVNGISTEQFPKNARSHAPDLNSPLKLTQSQSFDRNMTKPSLSSSSTEKGDKQDSKSNIKGQDTILSGNDSNNSLLKKTETVQGDQMVLRRTSSQDSFKVEGASRCANNLLESARAQRGRRDSKRKNCCEKDAEREKEKVGELSRKDSRISENKNVPPVVNGDASEAEKSRVGDHDTVDDSRSLCSEKSFVGTDINSMPVVFCGENFKETPSCLPDKSFGFEFGFGVTELMDSAYANSQAGCNDQALDVSSEVPADVSISDGLEDVSSSTLEDENVIPSPEGHASPGSVTDDAPTTPPVDVRSNAVRTNSQSHTTPTSHNIRHKHSSSTTYHRNYQYVATNQQYQPAMPQQGHQPQRSMQHMPLPNYLPPQGMPRGASPIQTFSPPTYPPPPHLQTPGIPPPLNIQLPINYSTPIILGRNPPEVSHQQAYALAAPMPAFGVGLYKVPQNPVVEQSHAAPQVNSHPPMTPTNPATKNVDNTASVSSVANSASNALWEGPYLEGADIAQFFVPLPSTISVVTEREVQKFMDDYVEKLNEMCRTGRIKFHRI